ncbi:MAG TPA: hypothetical protein VFR32_10810 [Gaiellaceae bacterium]|nr:hypothetical protein [Gaiellaceae bacterium]
MLRRLFGVAALAGLAVGAAVVYRRRAGIRRERVDLYYEDGSMATFEAGSAEGVPLLGYARNALAAARMA